MSHVRSNHDFSIVNYTAVLVGYSFYIGKGGGGGGRDMHINA